MPLSKWRLLRPLPVIWALAVAALVLALAASPRTAFAQATSAAPGIEIPSDTYLADFPKSVTFRLAARGEAEFTAATLRLKQAGQATVTTVAVKVERGREVSLEYVWDLQRYFVPPGVEIEYYWLLENAKGTRLRTATRVFELADARFRWQTLAEGPVVLRWYAGDERFAAELLRATVDALRQLGASAGISTERPVTVLVYASQRDLLGALGPTAQEWTGGQAFSDQGIVVAAIEANSEGLEFGRRVLPHEVSHVVVHRLTDNPYGDLPRWLGEGLAMSAEGPLEPAYQRSLDQAIRDNRLFSVQSLSANFPTDTAAALQSYAQSYSLVQFIMDRYGRERLSRLLEVFGEGSAPDPALEAALGVDGRALEAEWREWVGAPPRPAAKADGVGTAPTSSRPLDPILGVAGMLAVAALLAVAILARRHLAVSGRDTRG